jgi:hypothetical protein
MRNADSPSHSRKATLLTLGLVVLALLTTPPLSAETQDVEHEEIRKTRVIKVAGPGGKQAIARKYDVMSSRGYLGVEAVEMTPELREHFGAPVETGIMVSRVADGSPAQDAGLQIGDILTAVDEEPIGSFVDLFQEISRHEEGDVVRIEAWRDAQPLAFDATLAKMDRPRVDIRRFGHARDDEHHAVVWPEGKFDEVIELRTEAWDEAIDRLHSELNSEEWQERIDGYWSNQEELLERLESLESRLRELEGDLDSTGSDEP